MKLALAAAALLAVVAFAYQDDTFQGVVVKKPFDPSVHGKGGKTSSTQILYHGGPVMNVSNTVYVIYYGTFPSTTEPIINDFLAALSGSSEYGVNQTYNAGGSTAGVPIHYAFAYPSASPVNGVSGSAYFDNYSQGAQLSNKAIPQIVANALAGGLPNNQNGVYLVLTAPDVKISGFCTSFCAYHTSSTAISAGLHIRYALIPDPTQRCSGCNGNVAIYHETETPNGDLGADTMTDDIMHELSETVTDPDISAWYTQSGAENGDLCNYVYDAVKTTTVNGVTVHYNATLGKRNYLVQLIWKNSGAGFCSAQ
jgi:Phosphate-induced protein 1 conserved region